MNIYEIAKQAGVSAATVSRVMNHGDLVAEKTRERVQKVIREQEYHPNVFAKGLAGNSFNTIGILTTNIRDLYFASAIYTIVRYAKQSGYDIILSHIREGEDDKAEALQMLVDKRVDGIILIGSLFHEESEDHPFILPTSEKVPVVMLNSSVPEYIPEDARVYSVECDDEYGGYIATKHLLEEGCRVIPYIYDVDTLSSRNKRHGYLRALKEYGRKGIFQKAKDVYEGETAIRRILKKHPDIDGVFCSEDSLAAGVLKGIRKDPSERERFVRVIGYNDILIPQITVPELSSVNGKVNQLSERAFEIMNCILKEEPADRSYVIKPELVVRESSCKNLKS
ncbi:MAG: LacI family DNA-binding transcriptional regulator [Parasporobacterium sp.]|nr:LacI family DNA-binding transcriptional regulator [Parasporobacterium sp.]